MSRRNWLLIALVIVVVIIVAVFPTLHVRSVEDLVETLDCNRTLEDGESISAEWTDMQFKSQVITSISSNENVTVSITAEDPGQYTYNSEAKKSFELQEITTKSNWNMIVMNPADNGSPATMSGSIKAYRLETEEWLPWWMT